MPIYVIHDPQDTAHTARTVSARHAPDRGVVVCHPTPVRGLTRLPRDLLIALGKTFEAPESVNSPQLQWEAAGDWLAGEATSDLIVLRAHLLDLRTTHLLHTLACRLRALRVWLVSAGPELGDGARRMLARDDTQRAEVADLPTAPPAEPVSEPAPFPRVSQADFVLFARMCRRQLTASQRAQVGEAVAHGAHVARRALAARRDHDRRFAEQLFGDLLVTSGCADEALARFRGAQTALFLHGLHATFDAGRVRGLHARHGLDVADAHRARSLRAYASTQLACAGALGLALHQPARQMRELDIGDLVDDRAELSAIDRKDLRASIPKRLAGPVLAHLHRRVRQGAALDDPVFASRDGSDRIRVTAMHHALSKVARFSAMRLDLDEPHRTRVPMSYEVHLERLDDPCSITA